MTLRNLSYTPPDQVLYLYEIEASASGSSASGSPLLPDEDLDYLNTTLVEDLEESYRVPVAVEILMYVMYITVAVAAVGGNGIVCYIVLAYQRMRTVTNFFIVNLAIGDILMACLCIPFGFVSNLLLQYWPFGAIMCVVVSYSQAVSVFISAYTLIAISIDRYIAIVYPLRPRMSKFQAKLIIFLVWVVAILTPLPTAILSKLDQPPAWIEANVTDKYICAEQWDNYDHRYYYSMALMILQYFFPLTVLIYTYTRIAIIVWGKRTPGEAEDGRDQRQAASKRKMIKMMLVVVLVYTLCWLPLNSLVVVGDLDPSIYTFENMNYVWFACHWLGISTTVYNPFIYCWMNSNFKDGFRQLWGHLFCRRTKPGFSRHDANSRRGGSLFRQATYTSLSTRTNTSIRTNSTSVTMTPPIGVPRRENRKDQSPQCLVPSLAPSIPLNSAVNLKATRDGNMRVASSVLAIKPTLMSEV